MSFFLQTCMLFSLSVSTTLAAYSQPIQACLYLQTALPDQISYPNSLTYNESISSYAYVELQVRPTCIASPKSAQNVAAIIRIMRLFPSIQLAIRGGGHSTNKGFSNVENGITVDLSAINQVQLNQRMSSVSVGAGARWKDVYRKLDPYKISVQGGRNGDVGVSGLTIGGGIGFFSPERGWVSDSVINIQIVLSSGKIVNANSQSHPDLFVALKGGQNNFGVVTRFDLKTFPQGPLFGGVIIYSDDASQDVLDTFTTFKKPELFDPYAMITCGLTYDATLGVFTAQSVLYYSHPEKFNGSTLESFTKIKSQITNTLRMDTLESFATEKFGLKGPPVYMHWSTTTFSITPTILGKVYTLFKNTSLALAKKYGTAKLTISISIQSVPAAPPVTNPNSLGFDPSSYPEKKLVNVGVAFMYEDAAATDGLFQANKKLTQDIDAIAIAEGVKNNYIYMNYASSWQDVFGGYGAKSVQKMRDVAKKYDRVHMFQQQVKGGFKLV